MERIDVLSSIAWPVPRATTDLLAETEDGGLREIVELAATELDAPIAIVTLVLEHIQFFRAHYGLPEDLAAARGTRRDVSFCQFVILHGQTFEVNDADQDARVPKYLAEQYGVKSYLGAPIRSGDDVLGSLCVIDTKPRAFSADERRNLGNLATRVDLRLEELLESRRKTTAELTERATGPALGELRRTLVPLTRITSAGAPALTTIRSFLRLAEFWLSGGSTSPAFVRRSLDAAEEAVEDAEGLLHDVEATAADGFDVLEALAALSPAPRPPRLRELLHAAQDLSRGVTSAIGGAPMPVLGDNPPLRCPRPLAVGLMTAALSAVASRLLEDGHRDGITLRVEVDGPRVGVALTAPLPAAALDDIAAQLRRHLGSDPTIDVGTAVDGIVVGFAIASP